VSQNKSEDCAYPNMTFSEFNKILKDDHEECTDRLKASVNALRLQNAGHVEELVRIKNGELKRLLDDSDINYEPDQELVWYFAIFCQTFSQAN